MLTLTIVPSEKDRAEIARVDLSNSAGTGSILCKELQQDLRILSFDCALTSQAFLLKDVVFNYDEPHYSMFFMQHTEAVLLEKADEPVKLDRYMNAFFMSPDSVGSMEFRDGFHSRGFVVQFTESWLRDWLRNRSESSLIYTIDTLDGGVESFPAFTKGFLRILEHMERTPEKLIGELGLLLAIDDLLAKFVEHLHFTKIRFREQAMREALVSLKSTIASSIPDQQEKIEELAGDLGLPSTLLCQYFQRYFGISLQRYCIDSKMQAAMKRICQENLNLNELAQDLGFDCRSAFSKSFTEYFGYTPTEYRRSFGRA